MQGDTLLHHKVRKTLRESEDMSKRHRKFPLAKSWEGNLSITAQNDNKGF